MERLTYRDRNGYAHPKLVNYEGLLNKLADYEDAEEQGLLLRLPCPIGATVFELNEGECEGDFYNCHHNCEDCQCYSKKSINEAIFDFDMLNVIGKYVFLTREEAEKALADMGV